MRKLFTGLAIVLLSATLSYGAAGVTNGQGQAQTEGGVGTAFGTIGGAAGGQYQYGIGAATPGDQAYDLQGNLQTQNNGGFITDGAGNGSGSSWSTTQGQLGGGFADGGIYAYGQGQGQLGGAASANDGNGTNAVAGSAYIGASASGAATQGNAIAGAGQIQNYQGNYVNTTAGPGSFIVQGGQQEATIVSGAAAGPGGGAAIAGAGAVQAGGTLAQNNGGGTSMSGRGTAVGDAGAAAVAGGNAVGAAGANANQQHGYFQFNQNPSGSQQQTSFGVVGTNVNAGAVSP